MEPGISGPCRLKPQRESCLSSAFRGLRDVRVMHTAGKRKLLGLSNQLCDLLSDGLDLQSAAPVDTWA